jgi:hypothetical protein
MYLPTLSFTLSRYILNVWTRIARKAPDMIETVQYIFLAIASHTYGSAQYILIHQYIISFWRSYSLYSPLKFKQ